jgi:uncharacterized protein YuzB (UPF0349 family)
MKVRFCKNNKGKTKVAKRLLAAYPEVDVKIKECLKKCGPCKKGPYAVVDGNLVKGEDGDSLYRNIVRTLAGEMPGEERQLEVD